MPRRLTALLVGLLVAASAAPAVQADGMNRPRELNASACSSVKVASRSHVLYRHGVSCTFAKRWVRRLAASKGRAKPRGWSCTSGSRFRGGGYCQTGKRHFGWHGGD